MSPLVSVVIPCRNEAKAIAATVQALLNSTHANLEILVVDGMSEDGTRQVVKELMQKDARVQLLDNTKKLTPFAFNIGCRAARGEYVQIVGARNIVATDYIATLISALNHDPKVACVGGDYQHVFDSSAGRYVSLAMESKFGVGGGNYRTMAEDRFVDTVGVPLYRRGIFDEIGFFDENLTRNQDDDFNFRLRQAGKKILYVHAAKVTYLVRGELKKAFQQFRQYGYFKVFVNKKHGSVTTLRQLVPAAFFGVFALGLPLSIFIPWLDIALVLLALLYIAVGVLWAGQGLSLIERLRVLSTCFVLHAGYAYGYWQGIWDFIVCNRNPSLDLQRQTT